MTSIRLSGFDLLTNSERGCCRIHGATRELQSSWETSARHSIPSFLTSTNTSQTSTPTSKHSQNQFSRHLKQVLHKKCQKRKLRLLPIHKVLNYQSSFRLHLTSLGKSNSFKLLKKGSIDLKIQTKRTLTTMI